MRILATGKRDSVSGEEVVITPSERYSSGSSSENRSSIGAIIISDGAHSAFGNLPRKLNGVNAISKSTLQSSDKGKTRSEGNSQKKGKFGKKKSNHSSATKSPCSWKGRAAGKKAAFILSILNSYCCVTWTEEEGKSNKEESSCGSEKGVRKDKENLRVIAADDKVCSSNSTDSSDKSSVRNNLPSSSDREVVGESRENIDVTWGRKGSKDQITISGTANSKIMRSGIYHEKQVKSLCALHALNNLLQDGKAFKQEDLDKICSELDPNSWVNPHKSVFGLGNYDINVIMTALQQKKLEAIWFDKRKDPSHELNFDNIYGFILNIPSDCRLGWLALPIKRKHWVAIRNLPSLTEREAGRSNYYNLDSKFDKPDSIGTKDSLIDYLRGELKSPEKELFLVVTEDIGRLETWRKNPPPPPASTAIASSSASGAAGASSSSVSGATQFLPVPSGDDVSAGSGNGNFRRTSNDSGVVDLLPDLRDINVVDLNKEDLMRRQSSGVWSDLT